MHVGDRDLYNPNVMRDDMHDWVVANHRMAKVLKDKGYQYQYVFALDSGIAIGRCASRRCRRRWSGCGAGIND